MDHGSGGDSSSSGSDMPQQQQQPLHLQPDKDEDEEEEARLPVGVASEEQQQQDEPLQQQATSTCCTSRSRIGMSNNSVPLDSAAAASTTMPFIVVSSQEEEEEVISSPSSLVIENKEQPQQQQQAEDESSEQQPSSQAPPEQEQQALLNSIQTDVQLVTTTTTTAAAAPCVAAAAIPGENSPTSRSEASESSPSSSSHSTNATATASNIRRALDMAEEDEEECSHGDGDDGGGGDGDDDENDQQQRHHPQAASGTTVTATAGYTLVVKQPPQRQQRQRRGCAILGNPNNQHYRNCLVCARFPYRCPDQFCPLDQPHHEAGGLMMGYDDDDDCCFGQGGGGAFDFEAGIFEFLYRVNPNSEGGGGWGRRDLEPWDAGDDDDDHDDNDKYYTPSRALRLPAATAQRCVERCERYMKRLQVELARAGLLHCEDQSYICGDNKSRARMIAPFDFEELKLGRMLGTGGFSSVFEIKAIVPKPQKSSSTTTTAAIGAAATTPPLNAFQIAAREFMTKHAQRPVDDVTDINGSVRGGRTFFGGCSSTLMDAKTKRQSSSTISSNATKDISKKKTCDNVPTTARYAIKHLRRGLLREPDRFERAAIDLALEAQLLVAMDHENIISLRGWSRHGPQSFVTGQGQNTDYFLILDKLPETLDNVIYYKWRKRLKKYKTKLSRPWIRNKTKFITKLDTLLLHRLHAAQDVAAALEYMHDRHIINRDLKSANIGFDIRGDLKLFDFGLSRLLPSDRPPDAPEGYVMSRVGTKYYMAPEIKEKCPYHLSADVYSFGVVLWEILACATPREVLHRLRNRRQPESSDRQYQRRGVDLLEAMACAADNARTVAVQQRHRDGRCKLPICNCWPGEIQTMLKEALSNDPTKRPSMADLRFRLEEETEKLGSERRFEVTQHRRSTFRVDLTKMDSTENGNGESTINNTDNHNHPTISVLSSSLRSRTSHESSSQLSLPA